MTETIFDSVGQALHLAFVMETLPPTQQSSTATSIQRLLEAAGIDEGAGSSGSVNFKGLSRLEVRAQCAMIIAAVQDHLTEPEAAVLWAHYGWQTRRAAGVRYLCDYLQPSSNAQPEVLKALLWSIYAPRTTPSDRRRAERDGLTAAEIAVAYRIRKERAYEHRKMLMTHCTALRNRAESTLQQVFCRVPQGLVPCDACAL